MRGHCIVFPCKRVSHVRSVSLLSAVASDSNTLLSLLTLPVVPTLRKAGVEEWGNPLTRTWHPRRKATVAAKVQLTCFLYFSTFAVLTWIKVESTWNITHFLKLLYICLMISLLLLLLLIKWVGIARQGERERTLSIRDLYPTEPANWNKKKRENSGRPK